MIKSYLFYSDVKQQKINTNTKKKKQNTKDFIINMIIDQ